ncbi:MAG: ABC transporter permease [Rhodospirillales bacterium]|nr:ABC transporter permease [Rhodospirillales bacterium]
MSRRGFSWPRFVALVVKEFIQMRRDRLTFAMIISIPIMQLVLFGYAINTDPKLLPTAIVSGDNSLFTRSLIVSLQNSGYFKIIHQFATDAEAEELISSGDVQFVLRIPENFSRDLLRGDRPTILVEADATDPAATSNAVGTLNQLAYTALNHDLKGPLASLAGGPPPFEMIIHKRYNPEGINQFNIVPGLMGVVLTMTMIIFTALAVTRETERGTMETLLAMPVRPFEVMLGKVIPYIFVGYLQVALIYAASRYLFGVPVEGNLGLLSLVLILFIAANLCVGFTFSTIARNQLQAIQMSFFFFLPSLLLSGFMFPFRGMPEWAQYIGEALPLTHILRIVRGIMLKGNGITEIANDTMAIAAFLFVVTIIALKRYRQTMD